MIIKYNSLLFIAIFIICSRNLLVGSSFNQKMAPFQSQFSFLHIFFIFLYLYPYLCINLKTDSWIFKGGMYLLKYPVFFLSRVTFQISISKSISIPSLVLRVLIYWIFKRYFCLKYSKFNCVFFLMKFFTCFQK